MSELTDTIAEMTAPALRKKFYVALIFPLASKEEMLPYIPEHLGYMMARKDEIFLSGPFVKPGRLVDEGLTVFHTESEEQAAESMRNEPLTKRGLRRFELKTLNVCEGTLSLQIRALKSQAQIR